MFRPIWDRVVIEPVKPPEATASGRIFFPEQHQTEKAHRFGRVVSVGPGRPLPNGEMLPPPAQVGDLVVYQGSWTGAPIEYQGKTYRILESEDCAAVLAEGVYLEHQEL